MEPVVESLHVLEACSNTPPQWGSFWEGCNARTAVTNLFLSVDGWAQGELQAQQKLISELQHEVDRLSKEMTQKEAAAAAKQAALDMMEKELGAVR